LGPDLEPLSDREAHVLDLLARGFAYAEIARLLNVSPHTIGTYIKRLYRKLQVHSRSEAVYEAQKLGILDQS
jgi:DNA-binding NarL/FixJ family response regulator